MKRRRRPDPAIVPSTQNLTPSRRELPRRTLLPVAYLVRSLLIAGPRGSWDGRTPIRGRARTADKSPPSLANLTRTGDL